MPTGKRTFEIQRIFAEQKTNDLLINKESITISHDLKVKKQDFKRNPPSSRFLRTRGMTACVSCLTVRTRTALVKSDGETESSHDDEGKATFWTKINPQEKYVLPENKKKIVF